MVIKAGKFGLFLACSALSGLREHARARDAGGRRRRRDDRGSVRELRQADGVKRGRFGQFLACTGYPECKTTRKIIATKQGHGGRQAGSDPRREVPEVRVEPGASSRAASASSRRARNYPNCKYVKQKSTGVLCPKDGGDVVERKSRRGKVFYGCANYPDCDFTLWNKPMPEPCPECGAPFLVEKITKRHGRQLICNNEECDYVRSEEAEPVLSARLSRRHLRVDMQRLPCTIIGGGLAGSEAAWQAASLGVPVVLHEMRPVRADRRPQDRRARGARLQQLLPRRQAR